MAPEIVLAVVLLGGLLVGLGFYLESRRRKQFAEAASRLGLEYHPRDPGDVRDRWRGLAALTAGGTGHRVLHVLRGSHRGRRVACFEFTYTVRQGKHRTTHRRSVFLVEAPRWPRVNIVPENLGHKLVDALGMDDIDFESQAFSDRYWVTADDRRFAYDLVTPRMMEMLLDAPAHRWEVHRGAVCLWTTRGLKPDSVEPALDLLHGFVDLIPERLVREATLPPGAP